MKGLAVIIFLFALAGCDTARVYETDHDFTSRTWLVKDKPAFEFEIIDSTSRYNIYYRVRNSSNYPYARIFVEYSLMDPNRIEIQRKLVSNYLFDQKTGMPLGSGGIGDKFDHQFLTLSKHKFKQAGKHTIRLEQFMRTDTLAGIEAVGIRVEKAVE